MNAKRISLLLVILSLLTLGTVVVADTLATGPISSQDAGKKEIGFGDLLADALRSAANADIALVAAVSCKPGTIPAGPVTEAQLAAMLQNPGEVWAVSKLTGAQVQAAMEKSLSRLPGTNNGFLQVAGIKVTFDPDGPRNSRVKSITVRTVTAPGSETYVPLDPGKQYRVAMPLSLAKGGSGYFTIFDASKIEGDPSTQSLLQALTGFAFGKASITYPGTGRLIAQ